MAMWILWPGLTVDSAGTIVQLEPSASVHVATTGLPPRGDGRSGKSSSGMHPRPTKHATSAKAPRDTTRPNMRPPRATAPPRRSAEATHAEETPEGGPRFAASASPTRRRTNGRHGTVLHAPCFPVLRRADL